MPGVSRSLRRNRRRLRLPPMALRTLLLHLPAAFASWQPKPLRNFQAERQPSRGIRRFSHREERALEDGSTVFLHWDVDADPDELLSVDAEHEDGVRVIDCGLERLLVHLPAHLVAKAAAYRHIVASDVLHGCGHLLGDHLYRRIIRIEETVPDGSGGATLTFVTEELASVSQVLPFASFSFRFAPGEARSIEPRPARRLGWGNLLAGNSTQSNWHINTQESLEGGMLSVPPPPPPGTRGAPDGPTKLFAGYLGLLRGAIGSGGNIFNFVPREVSNFGWNWDYEKNSTKNEKFIMEFPGGEGYALFEKPCVRANAVMTLNFTSRSVGYGLPPHVNLLATLDGHSFISGDFTGIMHADDAYSDDIQRYFHLPLINEYDETTYLSPLEFYLGSVPIRISPGVRLGMNAYHIGRFKGSLRVGITTNLNFNVKLDFDSDRGLIHNVTVDLDDLEIKPPSWLIWTKHFEMGAMLEPEFWLKGSFGEVKNMKIDFDARPYMNVSISQAGYTEANPTSTGYQRLVVYPFRAIGLPKDEEFAVQIFANGKTATTSKQLSYGAIEYTDFVQHFDFGLLEETSLLAMPIEITLLRRDQEVARTSIKCTALVNGECQPAPIEAKANLAGKTVVIQMSVLWQEDPLTMLLTKIRSLSVAFPTLQLLEASSSIVSGSKDVQFRLLRNGRTYSARVHGAGSDAMNSSSGKPLMLSSNVIYELGRCYMDSWRPRRSFPGEAPEIEQLVSARLELVVDGQIIASSTMPALPWDQGETLSSQASHWERFEGLVHLNQRGDIPVDFTLKPANGGADIATGKMHVYMLSYSRASFWISPSHAETRSSNDPQELQNNLTWTVDAAKGEKMRFVMDAMHVEADGSYTHLFQVTESQETCQPVDYIKLGFNAFNSLRNTCAFTFALTSRERLRGKRVAFLLKWSHDDHMYEMISPPIDFTESRRLRGQEALIREAPDIDFDAKMKEINPTCSEEPIDYAIGLGVLTKEKVGHIRMPDELQFLLAASGEPTEIPDYDSGWLPMDDSSGSSPRKKAMQQIELAKLLPSAVCKEYTCRGQLPGCSPPRSSEPVYYPHIRFQLSRPIPWTADTPLETRHIIAYGLAVLPEAIEIGEVDANSAWKHWNTSAQLDKAKMRAQEMLSRAQANVQQLQRQVQSADVQSQLAQAQAQVTYWEQKLTGEAQRRQLQASTSGTSIQESDTFEAWIVEPLSFRLDDDLAAALVARGAWRGISDGREKELGPVLITSAKIQEVDRDYSSAPRQPLQLQHVTSQTWDPLARVKMLSSTSVSAAGVVAALAAWMAVVATARWGNTWRRYEQLPCAALSEAAAKLHS